MLKHRIPQTTSASTTSGTSHSQQPQSPQPNLTTGKSKIHIVCIAILVFVLVIRFFIIPVTFNIESSSSTRGDLSTNPRLPKHVEKQFLKLQQQQQQQQQNENNNNENVQNKEDEGDKSEYEEIELPAWVVNEIPQQKKKQNLPSLNQEPPQYPKETNNNNEAKKIVEDVIRRTFGSMDNDEHDDTNNNKIAENFLKVTTIQVLEEEQKEVDSRWCTTSVAAGSNSKVPECFKLEFQNHIEKNSNNNIHLTITGTTRIMATKGFYHVLKYFLDSSVMWGVDRTGINLNHELVVEKLSTASSSTVETFWREILIEKMKTRKNEDNDERTNEQILKLFGTEYLPKNNQQIDERQQQQFYFSSSSSSSSSPQPQVRIIHSSHTPLRYNYNLCTFAYTMSWWEWPEWEREIDWMALHGINMPLALVGQEAVWLKLWTEVLFPETATSTSNNKQEAESKSVKRLFVSKRDVLENHFTGAAFWPWHWMGNLRRWAGPVSLEYVDKRMILQKKILKRMRELKMFFTLPAFAGHVPEQVGRILSEWFDEELPPEENDRFSASDIMSPSEWINSFLKDSVIGKLLKGGGGGDQNNENNKNIGNKVGDGKRILRRRRRSKSNKRPQTDHIRRSALWMGFDGKSSGVVTLSPSHPLFAKISYYFMQTLTDMYGTAHFYSADQFNEMPPPTLHPQFLSQSGRAVVDGIQRVNPHGRWVVQGWLFLHHHRIWRPQSVKSYLDGAGKGNVVVLDLASDIRDLISIHDHFYGHDHIWCLLHNFGGRRGIFGHMPMILEKMVHASYFQILRANRVNKNLVGFGMTMEATHHNPALYELTTDLMFSDSFVGGGSSTNEEEHHHSLLLSKLIQSYPPTIREFSAQDGDVDIQNSRPSRTIADSLLRIWYKSFISYRYNVNDRIVKNDASSSSTTSSSLTLFSRLFSVDGPYAHPHDCCPSFSLIPFQPLVFTAISTYGMRKTSDLDTQYHPDSLFGVASWLLFKLSQQEQNQKNNKNHNRNLDTTIYDAIDFTRQVIDTVFFELHDTYQQLLTLCSISFQISSRNNNNKKLLMKHCVLRDDIKQVADTMINMIESLDELSCATPNFDLYRSWLKPAMEHWADHRKSGDDVDVESLDSMMQNQNQNREYIKSVLTSEEELEHDSYSEKDFKTYWKRFSSSSSTSKTKNNNITFSKSDVLFNAKNLITAWGDSRGQGYPNYAGRSWCGLYKRLYSKRWRRVLNSIQQEVDSGSFHSVFGASGQNRMDVMKLDWNFCVDHRKDIKRFEREQKTKITSTSQHQQEESIRSILSVASRWLVHPATKNNDLSTSQSTAWVPFMMNSGENTNNIEFEQIPSSKISFQAIQEALRNTRQGQIFPSSFDENDGEGNGDENNFYVLRQQRSWTSHPVATAAVCRAVKHCVAFDSNGGLYLGRNGKNFKEKVLGHVDVADAAQREDTTRVFFVKK